MKNYIKIARPDHWIKNLFIVPGIIVAFLILGYQNNLAFYVRLIIGFLATCLISSANYVINEWLDAEFDQYHPVKRNRPVVTSNLKLSYVILEYVLLVIIGLGLSFFINYYFVLIELWLLIMGLLYNVKPFRTKDIPYLDVLSESVNNIIRLLLGWFLITNSFFPPFSILIGYWMCGAFLMSVKRYSEYRMIGDPKVAGLYRKSFLHYTEQSLLCSSLFYSMSATVFTSIFIIEYRLEYILALPFLIGLFLLYFRLSFKEDSVVQKPEKLYREKSLLIYLVVFIFVLFVLTFVDIPVMGQYFKMQLIQNPLEVPFHEELYRINEKTTLGLSGSPF